MDVTVRPVQGGRPGPAPVEATVSRLVATLTTIAAPGDCSVDRAVNSAGQHAPDRGSAAIPPRARTPAYDSAGRISDNAWVTEATGCAP